MKGKTGSQAPKYPRIQNDSPSSSTGSDELDYSSQVPLAPKYPRIQNDSSSTGSDELDYPSQVPPADFEGASASAVKMRIGTIGAPNMHRRLPQKEEVKLGFDLKALRASLWNDEIFKPKYSPRGILLHGRVALTDERFIDFTKKIRDVSDETYPSCYNLCGQGSKCLPPLCRDPDDLDFLTSFPKYLILVDTADTFFQLTSNGSFPGVEECFVLHAVFEWRTARFLRLVKKMSPDVQILALVDSHPLSLKLLSFFEHSSVGGMPEHLADVKLDIKWLGFRRLHAEKEVANIPGVLMRKEEQKATAELLVDPFFASYRERLREVRSILEHNLITELLYLSSIHHSFLRKNYLPKMLENKDWI